MNITTGSNGSIKSQMDILVLQINKLTFHPQHTSLPY